MRYNLNLMHSRFYAPCYLHVPYFLAQNIRGGIFFYFLKNVNVEHIDFWRKKNFRRIYRHKTSI